jgi:hypothetical protein
MKSEGAIRHFVLAFVLALICYAGLYKLIEHRRVQKGPWEVTFTNNAAGAPVLLINQPKLAISDVQIVFPEDRMPYTNAVGTLIFDQPQPVPHPVPFGKCLFMDTTFLPGTVTLQVFGHEIELLPRALIIDRQDHLWVQNASFSLHPLEGPSAGPVPAAQTNAPPSQ